MASTIHHTGRRLPVGVELIPDGAHARVWAPRRRSVELVTYNGGGRVASITPLDGDDNGYFSGAANELTAGTRYRFRLDGGDAFPDPASRFQPDGPHGPSQIVDPFAFRWSDAGWKGITADAMVISEIHIGTFTPDGTFRGAIEKLDALADAGISVIEIMPIADFPGRFGWGYDGVNLYAPSRLYGTPDDLRALVDAAHARGIGVILDVVYNHLGPDGNYLTQFSDRYFKGVTEWGDALNFDGDDAGPVRELFVENAGYWISEFHLDGLRLDATQQIWDRSARHILADVVDRARAEAGDKEIVIVAENEVQDRRLLESQRAGGYGIDALWNDDFHHSALVALTGRAEAYYSGYHGTAQELVSVAKHGFLYQGQYYRWQKARRGTSLLGGSPKQFINFLESHDQVANLTHSARVQTLTSPGRYRAMTGLLFLMPQTPMLFQGAEFGASAAFPYFADHAADLARLVREGRAQFMSQFPSAKAAREQGVLLDPADERTFAGAKLDWSERERNAGTLAMHRDLIALRRADPVISRRRGWKDGGLDGAVINDHCFVLRFITDDDTDRLLVVNLGARFHADPIAEPLVAPPTDARWRTAWSSEDLKYGGLGVTELDVEGEGWWIPGEAAVLLVPGEVG